MLATQTMTGAAKKAKRDKKLSAESTAKPKSKTVEDPASKPSKLSKGKKRKEGESELVAELDQGVDEGIKKVKKAKKAHVDVEEATEKPGKDVVEVDDSIGEKKKRRKEKKEKAVVESPKQKSKTDKTITAEEEAVDIPQPKSKKSKKVVEVVKEALPEPSTKSTKPSKKSKKPVKEPSPDPSEDEVLNDAAEDAEEEEDDGHLHGFSTDDDDSSDEEDGMDLTPEGVDLGKLPTIAKDDATVKRKLEKAKRQKTADKGVIYIGRLPHGFFEDQLRGYFSQFGDVTRLRLSRNKKTGSSKHYAFLEFDSSSVAKIVAETMDNYLLMGHILQCEVIPKEKIHPELWVGANKKWKKVPTDRLERIKHDKPRTEEEIAKAESRLIKRQNQKKRKLEEAGIKYDFDNVAYKKKA